MQDYLMTSSKPIKRPTLKFFRSTSHALAFLLSSPDYEVDTGAGVAKCVQDSGSFNVSAVNVVHSQNAVVDSARKDE